jgi:hypothetical protein
MFTILVSILAAVAAFFFFIVLYFGLTYYMKNYDMKLCKWRGSSSDANAHAGAPSLEAHIASSENMNPMAEIHVVQPASATQTI